MHFHLKCTYICSWIIIRHVWTGQNIGSKIEKVCTHEYLDKLHKYSMYEMMYIRYVQVNFYSKKKQFAFENRHRLNMIMNYVTISYHFNKNQNISWEDLTKRPYTYVNKVYIKTFVNKIWSLQNVTNLFSDTKW